ncbi:MAG: cob(I)yrinic acid a,c-diamide adenosyltransferase [bacterium]|nr:cob(I)yrinic acid a,c-diamide adenosyltransferase [bacterium]
MAFEDYKKKDNIVVVYTGEGKGKTSASIGLMARALGTGWSVAYIQFVKHWEVGEHKFIKQIQPLFKEKLYFFKGGKGFYNAGEISAKDVSAKEHKQAAEETLAETIKAIKSEKYQLVICDEINNSVHDGLLTEKQLEDLIDLAKNKVSLCLTGRDFPQNLVPKTDIATNMTKLKHHFDDKFIANPGIDF